jgi:hypothetical protein
MDENNRKEIFNLLRTQLMECVPPMVVKEDKAFQSFEIIGNKEVPYGYNKKLIPGMYFASLAQRKDSIVLYFFPAYGMPDLLDGSPNLNKCLKGKTCFHFTKAEQINHEELKRLLEEGVKIWMRLGYVK